MGGRRGGDGRQKGCDDGAAGLRRAYSDEKLARLTAVKDAYDPDNVFHLNQNIRPSAR